MIDIGANLASESFANDLPEVIERAKNADINKIVVTGSNLASSQKAKKIADQHPDYLFSTAGLHPHEADHFKPALIKEFETLLLQNNVIAIGETGLDYNRNFSEKKNQITSFEAHLALATKIKKPLFLHERDAFTDFYSIIKAHSQLCEKAIVHCFTGDLTALKAYLDLGLHIGITGWICDKKRGENLRKIISYAPLERLMIETDAPYLTPHKEILRKQLVNKNRNEPWTLKFTAKALAEAINCKVDKIILETESNSKLFFGL